MNLIPFDSKTLPAYLKAFNISEINADLTAHAGGGFPVISIKGKVFAIVRDGERLVLPNPKDPDSPATAIDLVLLKANKGVSKVFYLKGYDKDAEGQKPDCYSNEGVVPAADAQNRQSKVCATCPHNQWGSRISEKGATKGKACSDSVRLAVAPAGQLNDAMLLRVPPASIRALGEYGQLLAKRGVAYSMMVTKVGFDMTAESPKLTFKPVGYLDDDGFAEVREMVLSDVVQNILGGGAPALPALEMAEPEEPVTAQRVISKAKAVTIQEVTDAVEQAAPVVTKPAPRAAAKPAPKPVAAVEDDMDLDLEGINFDD